MITFREAIGHVMRLRSVWILCIATAGVSGGVTGMLGFLPLYLRDLGWEPAIADGTLASFHAASTLFSPPVGNWLAKFGSGLPFLFWASLVFLGFVAYLLLPHRQVPDYQP